VRIVAVYVLQNRGVFAASEELTSIHTRLKEAVGRVSLPWGRGEFTAHAEGRKRRSDGSSVRPIKDRLMLELEEKGWERDGRLAIAGLSRPARFDAVFRTSCGPAVLEWTTGDDCACHRTLNRMALGLFKRAIVCGILIVSSPVLRLHLTDCLCDVSKLKPYLDFWKSLPCQEGVIEVVVVEHDEKSVHVPKIPGPAGRALKVAATSNAYSDGPGSRRTAL
jgi:hypothetical protein